MSSRTTRSTPVPFVATAEQSELLSNGAPTTSEEPEQEQIEYLEEDDPMFAANESDKKESSAEEIELGADEKSQGNLIVKAVVDDENAEEFEVAVFVEEADVEDAAPEEDILQPKKDSALNNKRKKAGEKESAATIAQPRNNKKAAHTSNTFVKSDEYEEEEEEEEQPTSSARAAARKEESVDEEQCRVCTTKDDLVSLFKTQDKTTVADLLMVICPTVSIARKDFMPQYICTNCLDKVNTAVQLKTQCETTERELRKKLSRHKNKVRRPAGFLIIDAPAESDPPSEDEPADDEFKVSDVEASASSEDDSEDSEVEQTKRKRSPRGRGRQKYISPPKPKKRAFTATQRASLPMEQDEEEIFDEQIIEIKTEVVSPKKKSKDESQQQREEWPCDECNQVFTRKLSLTLHKKAHGGRTPLACPICNKQFKIHGALKTHMERHNDPNQSLSCNKCDVSFISRTELRQHMAVEHGDLGVIFQCEKCRRHFVSNARLLKHQEGRCPGFESRHTKRANEWESVAVGKDLFKTVAPLTTTYWSDSFSD